MKLFKNLTNLKRSRYNCFRFQIPTAIARHMLIKISHVNGLRSGVSTPTKIATKVPKVCYIKELFSRMPPSNTCLHSRHELNSC